MIIHFTTTVFNFSDWFQQIGMRPMGGESVSQLSCCCMAHSQHSHLPIRLVYKYCSVLLLQYTTHILHFTFLLLVFCKLLEANTQLTLKMYLTAATVLSVPIIIMTSETLL